jgi:chemotaxis methyl-accepting protein methylase
MDVLIDVTQAATVTYSTKSAFDRLFNCNVLIYFDSALGVSERT